MASPPPSSNPPTTLKPGTYSPPRPTDLRSPCPGINALANHGYLPRSGLHVPASALKAGMNEFGLGDVLSSIFTYPIFYEHHPSSSPTKTHWTNLLSNPLQSLFANFGMRTPGETDPDSGVPVLNLDQLAQHGIVEHDVSLSRRDLAQGDNLSPQADLIAELLSASSDGVFLTVADLVALRRRRYARQKRDNPALEFGERELFLGCAEVALLLKVFGDGEQVRVEYMRAFFEEGRLPREEGWVRRSRWWTLGFVELNLLAARIKRLVGWEEEDGEESGAVLPPPVAAVPH